MPIDPETDEQGLRARLLRMKPGDTIAEARRCTGTGTVITDTQEKLNNVVKSKVAGVRADKPKHRYTIQRGAFLTYAEMAPVVVVIVTRVK